MMRTASGCWTEDFMRRVHTKMLQDTLKHSKSATQLVGEKRE